MRNFRDLGRRLKQRRSRRGSLMIEVAIVLPLLVLVVFGCVDFGRFVYVYCVVTNAAEEGATYGSLHPTATEAQVEAAVFAERSTLIPVLTAGDVTFVRGAGSANTEVAQTITVTVTTNFPLLVPGIFTYWGLPATVPIGRTVVMPLTR